MSWRMWHPHTESVFSCSVTMSPSFVMSMIRGVKFFSWETFKQIMEIKRNENLTRNTFYLEIVASIAILRLRSHEIDS